MAEEQMRRTRSAWRPDDIVAYEEMRDLAVAAQDILIARARRDVSQAAARTEAARLRHETLAIDGFDRKAVDEHTRRLALRLTELRIGERDRD